MVIMVLRAGGASLVAERSPSGARAVERGAAKPRGRGRGQRNTILKSSNLDNYITT